MKSHNTIAHSRLRITVPMHKPLVHNAKGLKWLGVDSYCRVEQKTTTCVELEEMLLRLLRLLFDAYTGDAQEISLRVVEMMAFSTLYLLYTEIY